MNPHASFAPIILATALSIIPSSSFVQPGSSPRASTHLNLENHIADMIDGEAKRLTNIGSWREEQAEKIKKGKEPSLPQGFDFNSVGDFGPNADAASKIQLRKDKRMARDDPQKYCADRCVATGNCEVWEDMFDMHADEVQQFCTECVLSEEEEPCEIPEKFIENAGKNSWELAP